MDPSRPITDPKAASPFQFLGENNFHPGREGQTRVAGRHSRHAPRSLARLSRVVWFPRVSSLPTLATIPLSFRSLFSSLNVPVVLSIEPIVCPPNTFNDLNPTRDLTFCDVGRSPSAFCVTVSCDSYHANRFNALWREYHALGYRRDDRSFLRLFRERERRVLSSLCPFLTFSRVGQGYVDREKRESRLWLNSFWLNYSDFIVGFVVTLWYVVGFFFQLSLRDNRSIFFERFPRNIDPWSMIIIFIDNS